MNQPLRKKPEWLKAPAHSGENFENVRKILKQYGVNTVCDEACCPNRGECFNLKTATFMILGRQCTRNCRFCAVHKGSPEPVDENEPMSVAGAVKALGLKYVVITSVTRDDLPDGGAAHFAATVRAIKQQSPDIRVEVLIPDFKGDLSALKTVADAGPDVVGHNVETVPSLYQKIRPMADYRRSLKVIAGVKEYGGGILSKTGIMVGVGETQAEIIDVFSDIVRAGCDIVTIGQYLAPSVQHYPVKEYVHPDVFAAYKQKAEEMGILYAASSPLTRSSHLAVQAYEYVQKQKG